MAVAGPSATLGVGWRRNQSPGQRVLVWHDEKWRNGKIKTLSESKIDVGLDGATDTSVIKRRDSIDVQPAMEDRGMSLPQLEQFWAYCCGKCQGGRIADPDSGAQFQLKEAPTWLIVKTFVKELTRAGEIPLVDALADKWPEGGGPSPVTYFVSYAWNAPFYPTLLQLKEVGGGTFWLDCFACTQGGRLELLDDSEVFARALQASCTKAQVLCLDRRASALQRLWVIFEILRAYQAGKPLLIPSPEQLEWGYASIIWGKTQCTVESDREYIISQVSAVGEESVSQCVRDSLLQSFRARVDAALLEFGDGSHEVAKPRDMLGIVLKELGKLQEARLEHEAALAIKKQHFGTDHPEVAKTRNNLGIDLRLLGKLQEAKQEHEAALAIQRQHFGTDHPEVAATRDDLGNVLRSLGQLQEAKKEHEAALAIKRHHSGTDHREVAAMRNNLGLVLADLGQLREAKQELEAALAIYRQHFGTDRPEVAATRYNVGYVLSELGQVQEAKQEYEAALAIRMQHFGTDHPDVAATRNNLGFVLQDLGELQEAKQEYEAALAIERQHFGTDHPEVAVTRNNLGAVLSDLGQLQEAKQEYEAALAIKRQHFGTDHPEVALTRYNLGLVLRDLSLLHEARQEFRAALSIFKLHFRDDHSHVRTVQNNLDKLERHHPDVGLLRENLESVSNGRRQPSEKKEEHKADPAVQRQLLEEQEDLEADLAAQRKRLGDDHLQVAETRALLAEVLVKFGKSREAMQEYELALPTFIKHFGQDGARTQKLLQLRQKLSEGDTP